MAEWAIRTEPRPHAPIAVQVELGRFGAGRRCHVSQGDGVVLFERGSMGIVFWGTATVDQVTQTEVEDGERILVVATLILVVVFDEPRYLADLRFSLPRVSNVGRPAVHFHRAYLRLRPGERQSIVGMLVDGPRTAVGLIVEALPIEDRLELLRRLASQRPSALRSIGYAGVLQQVVHFVEGEYVEPARLLLAVNVEERRLCKSMDGLDGVLIGGSAEERDGGRDEERRESIRLADLVEEARPVVEGFAGDSTPFDRLASSGVRGQPPSRADLIVLLQVDR